MNRCLYLKCLHLFRFIFNDFHKGILVPDIISISDR